ncbi:MAG: hypothetical protein K2J67_10815 [Lachnospiraceae bacterium]|nr:hypothetical protein [Lachnospiraceae bacterium]
MDQKMMVEVFRKAFTEITMKLTKIPLQESDNGTDVNCEEQMVLFIHGFIEAEIVCLFAKDLYLAIVTEMHGGTLPAEQESILYLKEYMNIVCGRAVSALNNEIGKPSRLSVPYYQEEVPEHHRDQQQEIRLFYETEYGAMQVKIAFSAGQIKEGLMHE